MTPSDDVLDLYDISLLLNYERASNEPRFRHTKLREVASATSPFQTVIMSAPEWLQCRTAKDGFVFDVVTPDPDAPDLPSNMLPNPVPQSLKRMAAQDLERIYWQARGHDGCFKSIVLLQHFFDLYPDAKLRIRTPDGAQFLTPVASRSIEEMELRGPKLMTLILVVGRQLHITGDEASMNHAVMEFRELGGSAAAILDLASLQFGDAGRGMSGRSTFVLESRGSYLERLDRVAAGNTLTKSTHRIRPCEDDEWLKPLAEKVKKRWEGRREEPWCGHCGAPGMDLKKCSLCHQAWYCDVVHQAAAWPFHRKFCRRTEGAAAWKVGPLMTAYLVALVSVFFYVLFWRG
ncbi:hypothetical protein C8R43DRAFT_494758 [Mycena crocata]|nr:hypothetical protein C8R43DRAFT_494758 [Mycena crocata]